MEVMIISDEKEKDAIAQKYGDVDHQYWDRDPVMCLLHAWEASKQKERSSGVETHCRPCKEENIPFRWCNRSASSVEVSLSMLPVHMLFMSHDFHC